MSEYCQDALCCQPEDLTRALSIHTRKITDSCRDKDCIEDLRVYFTRDAQDSLNAAAGARVRSAELLYTSVDVSPVAFNRNHYLIDLTFYYRIVADSTVSTCRPGALFGLALFSKRAVLCGAGSQVHLFSSQEEFCPCTGNLPTAVVEVLDPIVLSSRLSTETVPEVTPFQLPACVQESFDEELVYTGGTQNLFVTLGQFSIIRLERDAQIIVPVLDYAIPSKECQDDPGSAEDPCDVFSRIPFPTDSFTPMGCGGDATPGAPA